MQLDLFSLEIPKSLNLKQPELGDKVEIIRCSNKGLSGYIAMIDFKHSIRRN